MRTYLIKKVINFFLIKRKTNASTTCLEKNKIGNKTENLDIKINPDAHISEKYAKFYIWYKF